MKKIIFIFVAAFFCAWLMPGHVMAKALCVTYDIKTKVTTGSNDGKKEEKEHSSQFTARLGDGCVLIEGAGKKELIDIKNKRIIYINSQDKKYSDVSLFSDIGFRYMEFQNRFFIRDVLNAAMDKSRITKPADPEADFDIESLFGITKPGSKEQQIQESWQGDTLEYSFNGRVVVEAKLSEEELSEADAGLLERFLIYRCYLHPQIRKSIVAKKRLPRMLKFSNRESVRAREAELNMVKVFFEDVDFRGIPAGYTKVYQTSSQELSDIIENVMSGKSGKKRLEKSDFIKIADGLTSRGSYFDAMLVTLECGLQTGENIPEVASRIMAAGGKNDLRIRAFFGSLSPKDKESAEKAVKNLESIDRKGLTHGYVIDIMIADDLVLLSGFDKAKELFLKVLKANPYIAGVYKDLGDPFHSSYDMVSAWQCWDTARYLYPRHPMLQKIDEYEQWLTKTFPDFFLQ